MSKELEKKIEILRNQSNYLLENYHVKKIGIFGSFSKGIERPASDIDILVEFYEPVGFFSFSRLEDYLSKTMKRKVDLVSKNALKPAIKKKVLSETIYV